MRDTIIKVENLSFWYETDYDGNGVMEKHVAIDNVSIEIERGSFVAIVGSNGSGKSTLAKHLNALLLPCEGNVIVDGMNTKDVDPIEIRRRVGMVFQNPDNQLVSSVVEDDVAFGPENLGIEPDEIRRRVDEALKKVSMYEFRKKGPHLLSGGQKQRVAIAGAIAMRSDCIVFDEPTAMLDPSGRKEIMQLIEELHDDGITVILITHFMEEAAQADKIIVMDESHKLADGTPEEVFNEHNLEMIREASLELPFAVKLAGEMRRRGYDIPESVITDEELADYICRLK